MKKIVENELFYLRSYPQCKSCEYSEKYNPEKYKNGYECKLCKDNEKLPGWKLADNLRFLHEDLQALVKENNRRIGHI